MHVKLFKDAFLSTTKIRSSAHFVIQALLFCAFSLQTWALYGVIVKYSIYTVFKDIVLLAGKKIISHHILTLQSEPRPALHCRRRWFGRLPHLLPFHLSVTSILKSTKQQDQSINQSTAETARVRRADLLFQRRTAS